jgi:hypothetical protein
MALKRTLRIGASAVLIAGRGRFEMRDVGPRGFGVGVWIPVDAPPRLVALSDAEWAAVAPDVLVRLTPRKGPSTGGALCGVCFEVPKEIKIIQVDQDTPIIQESE